MRFLGSRGTFICKSNWIEMLCSVELICWWVCSYNEFWYVISYTVEGSEYQYHLAIQYVVSSEDNSITVCYLSCKSLDVKILLQYSRYCMFVTASDCLHTPELDAALLQQAACLSVFCSNFLYCHCPIKTMHLHF